jgi:hypothetical protein
MGDTLLVESVASVPKLPNVRSSHVPCVVQASYRSLLREDFDCSARVRPMSLPHFRQSAVIPCHVSVLRGMYGV